MTQDARAHALKEQYTPEIMALPGVVGVGVGKWVDANGLATDETCLVVMVINHQIDISGIPDEVDGVRIQVRIMGTFTAG